MDSLDKILLETLSFYDPLSIEQILLQMDRCELETLREITMKDLQKRLLSYKRRGMVKKIEVKNDDIRWIRVHPSKSIFKRIFPFFVVLFLFFNAEKSVAKVQHVVTTGDSLMKISYKYYGTHHCWRIIAKANDLSKNKDALDDGRLVTIPHFDKCIHKNKNIKLANRWRLKSKKSVIKKTKSKLKRFTIQLASYKALKDAKHLQLEFILIGLETRIEKVVLGDSNEWHRVRLGMFSTFKEASDFLKKNELNQLAKGAFVVKQKL